VRIFFSAVCSGLPEAYLFFSDVCSVKFFSVVCSGLQEAYLAFQCCLFRFARSLPIFSVLSVPVCQKLAYFFSVVCSGLPEGCLLERLMTNRKARTGRGQLEKILPLANIVSIVVNIC
jgi:hypothetical protein